MRIGRLLLATLALVGCGSEPHDDALEHEGRERLLEDLRRRAASHAH